MAVTRRSFVKRGLLGGALLAVGGAGFLSSRSGRLAALPAEGLRVLDAVEYSVVAALAARLIPDRPGFPTAESLHVAQGADRVLERTDATAQMEVKQLLKLFENGLTQFLFEGRARPFTRLSGPEQDAVIRSWQESRLLLRRTGMAALRSLVVAVYYGQRASWNAVGYPGPPEGFHQPDAPVWRGGPL